METRSYHHGDLKNGLIQAGMLVLSERGVGGLTLRGVAQRAGVSHSAPYAHFKDKQQLLAAIATEGFEQLYDSLQQAASVHPGDPRQQVVQAALAYLDFALQRTELFQLMFSRSLAVARDQPDLQEVTRRMFQLVVQVVSQCSTFSSQAGTTAELKALIIWGQVHGIVQLALENQISSSLLCDHTLPEILTRAILNHWMSGSSPG